ncbi:DUF3887 domain-containing protein [Clostridium vincentii]|uniref:DUF3887 domain-containing protein n=1 Tax=Clostridium vincentii TaxID=52704 RepID=A0A2T0B9Z3_9CLOT|nr:DUF3887 domain-containing protein [Clostridium vincentii]PRR80710.1 hypothetical protein CLVI_30010 [Clostridium vincentii]
MRKKLFNCLFILIILSLFAGCSKEIEYSQVSTYADTVTTSLLTSINELDYDKFSSNLNDEMKDSYDFALFQKETNEISATLGTFQSLSFYYGEKRGDYFYLIYNTNYSNSDKEIRVSITFKENDETHKVCEFYFDSADING